MHVLSTDRLDLRRLTIDDAPFVLQLVNDPAWLEHIGDKGVRTLEGARNYIRNGPLCMYERLGFGLYLVELRRPGAGARVDDRRAPGPVSIGLCGLIKRDALPDVDIGYAFLPDFRGRGYAHEAALAVLEYGHRTLGMRRIVAITTAGNASSIRLLEKVGMRLQGVLELSPGDPVRLYARDF